MILSNDKKAASNTHRVEGSRAGKAFLAFYE